MRIKLSEFNPRKTFLCGQCFRRGENAGIALGRNNGCREFRLDDKLKGL
ncbi:MAG: hypothetical protein ACI4JT_06585 [Oscillospiraceae bacterium]